MVSRALATASLAVLVAGGACTDDVVLAPVIDSPPDTDDAAVFADLDQLQVTIAVAGQSVQERTFSRGETIELPDIRFSDRMTVHMTGSKGTNQIAYGRTCEFTLGAQGASPHLLLSRTNYFAVMTAPQPRVNGRAVPFDNKLLLLGGQITAQAQNVIEEFDPMTGVLAPIGRTADRIGVVDALLGSGDDPVPVLIGGQAQGSDPVSLETITASAASAKAMPFSIPELARVGLTATTLTDGRVIVIGGEPPNGPPEPSIVELRLQDAQPSVSVLNATGFQVPRIDHTATRLAGDNAPVLVVGGVDNNSMPVVTAELFFPQRDAFDPTFLPQMQHARSRHQAVLMPDGSVLIVGGVDGTGKKLPLEQFIPYEGKFIDQSPADPSFTLPAVDFALTTLPDGRVLVTGGADAPGGPAKDTAFLVGLNPEQQTINVVQAQNLTVARAGHQASLLCDGTVWISGGTPDQSISERYNPGSKGRAPTN